MLSVAKVSLSSHFIELQERHYDKSMKSSNLLYQFYYSKVHASTFIYTLESVVILYWEILLSCLAIKVLYDWFVLNKDLEKWRVLYKSLVYLIISASESTIVLLIF